MTTVRIGFIPLVDAALLVAARDEGFAADEGLTLELIREVSWANIRDKLNVGLFDAAHMLAPAAIASTLGLGHVQVPLAVPAALNLNGNAITVSRRVYDELAAAADGDIVDPARSALALVKLIDERRRRGEPPLTFANTFHFSMHNYQLRIWMRRGGIDPDEDVRLVVIPPPLMAKSLENGHIDGFCVGAPWNAMTVAGGGAVILHLGTQIVAHCPEKVLALPAQSVEAPFVLPLVRSLVRAAAWCGEPRNRPLLARHLARVDMLGVSAGLIEQILDGRLPLGTNGRNARDADYLRLDPAATRPTLLHADFLVGQMALAHQIDRSEGAVAAARAIYRRDIFDAAIAPAGVPEAPSPAPVQA
jgi:NitT/TauT family transport system ATP-binding protein